MYDFKNKEINDKLRKNIEEIKILKPIAYQLGQKVVDVQTKGMSCRDLRMFIKGFSYLLKGKKDKDIDGDPNLLLIALFSAKLADMQEQVEDKINKAQI
jgi:hypothetical protein